MSTPDLSTASRIHLKRKEDQKSAGNRSFEIDGKFHEFCGLLGLAPPDAGGKITFLLARIPFFPVGTDWEPVSPSR
jgi:hypothetical protein